MSACIYSNPTWAKPQNKDNAKDYTPCLFSLYLAAPRNFDRIISRYLILDFHALRFLSQKRDISTIQS